jgi:hypothetical protein
MWVSFFSTALYEKFFGSKNIWRVTLCDRQILLSNTKFHDNPYSGSRDVTCGQADVEKTADTFRSFCLQTYQKDGISNWSRLKLAATIK